MADLWDNLYMRDQDEPHHVITFGKSPAQTTEDREKGIARFGGMRAPSYVNSYWLAAHTLLESAVASKTLDDLALPIFYLQRHAAELLIKRLLDWGFDIADLCEQLQKPGGTFPTSEHLKRRNNCHDLPQLLADLSDLATNWRCQPLPSELQRLVKQIGEFETTDTWARYARGRKKIPGEKAQIIHHVKNEVAIPMVELQAQLGRAVRASIETLPHGQTLEAELYDRWYLLAREAGEAG